MAATVGATLSGVTFPLRHSGMGPFISAAGNVYFVGRDATNTGQIEVHKASNPMSSFSVASNLLFSSGNTTAIEAIGCYQFGQELHIATQIATGAVYWNALQMDTDLWARLSAELAVAAASFAPLTNATWVSIVVRSNGNPVIVYCAGQTAMSSNFHMVRYRERTGINTYSTATNVDNGGSVNWSTGLAVLGSSNRVHIFFHNNTAQGLYQRTLSAANALETFPAAYATPFSATNMHYMQQGVSYDDGGTQRVRVAAAQIGAAGLSLTKLDSADAPTVTTENSITTTSASATNSQHDLSIANDGTTLHVLYHDTTQDLIYDSSANNGGAWGADSTELTATINRITVNRYVRSGSTVLGIVLDDAGTIKYAEITLAAAPSADPDVQVLSVPQLITFY